MTGFEPRIFGIGSDPALTTEPPPLPNSANNFVSMNSDIFRVNTNRVLVLVCLQKQSHKVGFEPDCFSVGSSLSCHKHWAIFDQCKWYKNKEGSTKFPIIILLIKLHGCNITILFQRITCSKLTGYGRDDIGILRHHLRENVLVQEPDEPKVCDQRQDVEQVRELHDQDADHGDKSNIAAFSW